MFYKREDRTPPPLAKVKGVGRQQHAILIIFEEKNNYIGSKEYYLLYNIT